MEACEDKPLVLVGEDEGGGAPCDVEVEEDDEPEVVSGVEDGLVTPREVEVDDEPTAIKCIMIRDKLSFIYKGFYIP